MKLNIFLILTIFIFLGTSPLYSASFIQIKDNDFIESTLIIGNDERVYRLYIPKNYYAGNPAVIILHGGTQSMRKIFNDNSGATKHWINIADKNGILLIIPNASNSDGEHNGNKQMWNDLRPVNKKPKINDVEFINQLTDYVIAHYGVNEKRVYLTGGSNGGMMTYRLLLETPERYAAAATFIASLPQDESIIQKFTKLKRTTPLMIMNGTADPLVKWEGGDIFFRGGTMMPAAKHAELWARANLTAYKQAKMSWINVPEKQSPDNPSCAVQLYEYPALLPDASPVTFYIVHGNGHAIPSLSHTIPDNFLARNLIGYQCNNIEGIDMAWKFLKQFSLTQ